MKRYPLAYFALVFLSACQANTPVSSTSDTVSEKNIQVAASADSTLDRASDQIPQNQLIVPGERIGQTRINESGDELFASKNKPDASDAAMGKAWNTWYSTSHGSDTIRHELNIFTSVKMGPADEQPRVKIIRVTSPFFSTENKISVGKSKAEVAQVFPGLRKIAVYPSSKGEVSIYDDRTNGIAFEFSGDEHNSPCVAVLVYEKRTSLPGQIAGIHNGLKMLNDTL